jgi:hypothetical protein
MTGYPNISTFHEFRYHPKTVTTGGFDTWMYDHLGMFSWTVEIWSPLRQAGLKDYKYIDWYREHPLEDDLKLMKWNDEVLGGKAYVDWYPFDHPQLGKVELGGWDSMNSWTNPPPAFLEKEVALFPDWVLWHLLISPKLVLRQAEVKTIETGTYRIRMGGRKYRLAADLCHQKSSGEESQPGRDLRDRASGWRRTAIR